MNGGSGIQADFLAFNVGAARLGRPPIAPVRRRSSAFNALRVICAVLASVPAAAFCNSRDLSVDLQSTFADMPAPLFGLEPVTVTLANRGRDAVGALDVQAGGYEMTYPVELPSGTVKRLIAYVPAYSSFEAAQFALSTDRWATVQHRDIERFVFSYDLWEEKFSITKLGSPRRSASRLSARAAESWCIEEMALPQAGLAPEQSFWLRLEARAENPAEDTHVMTEEGVSLTRLVEIFSRRARSGDSRWSIDAGPFRLSELARLGVVR